MCPGWFCVSPEREISWPHRAVSSSALPPSIKITSSSCWGGMCFCVFSFVTIVPHPLTGHHWEESDTILLDKCLWDIYIHWWDPLSFFSYPDLTASAPAVCPHRRNAPDPNRVICLIGCDQLVMTLQIEDWVCLGQRRQKSEDLENFTSLQGFQATFKQ